MLHGRKMPLAAEIDFRKSVPSRELVKRQPPLHFHDLPARVVEYEVNTALESVRRMGVIRRQPDEFIANDMRDEFAHYMEGQAIHEVAACIAKEPGLLDWKPNGPRDEAALFDREQRKRMRTADAGFERFMSRHRVEERAEIVVMSKATYETLVSAMNRLFDIAEETEKKNG